MRHGGLRRYPRAAAHAAMCLCLGVALGAAVTSSVQAVTPQVAAGGWHIVALKNDGTLRAVGRPVLSARRTALWEVTVSDDRGRTVATGRVRLLVVEQGSQLAGRAAATGGPEPASR